MKTNRCIINLFNLYRKHQFQTTKDHFQQQALYFQVIFRTKSLTIIYLFYFETDKVDCNQLPLYNLHIDSFRKRLQDLISEYEIPFNSTLSTQADEMDLFGAIDRRFKTLYKHQQKCCTFYQCDNSPKGKNKSHQKVL